MYRYALTVPQYDNEGNAIAPAELESVESILIDIAGGFTATVAIGGWRADDGAIYREPVTVYTVDSSTDIGARLRQLAEWIALAMRQEAVYLTRAPLNGAELIAAPSDRPGWLRDGHNA